MSPHLSRSVLAAAALSTLSGCGANDGGASGKDAVAGDVAEAPPSAAAPVTANAPPASAENSTPQVAPGGTQPPNSETTPNPLGAPTPSLVGGETDAVLIVDDPQEEIKPPESCAGLTLEPETLIIRTPVTLFLAIDNSVSMSNISSGGLTNWERAVMAIDDFVNAPSSEGIGVALQYFRVAPPPAVKEAYEMELQQQMMTLGAPVPQEPFDPVAWEKRQDKCDGVMHAQSAVNYGRIPDVSAEVVDFLTNNPPVQGGTFTVGSLIGAVDYCANFQAENPDERCIAVMVTDGMPNGCGLKLGCTAGFTPDDQGHCVDPDSEGVLVPIAEDGAARGVDLYTVGMDGVGEDGFDLLDKIAVAGGTDCSPNKAGEEACNVTSGGGASLLEALNSIRKAVVKEITVPCSWEVPEPPEGRELDPKLINVDLKVKQEPLPLGQVSSEADCAAVDGGWYYDNPLAPQRILSCPQTCDIIDANPKDVRVSIEIGCATRRAIVQ